ncbi:hypothetical protein ACWD5R_43385 [Streptomyces sp. NPDC002514]|uniref:hypothetical protein n=1 Tax=Streptomyces sp. NPDC001270 TaxID=3364554 RepID=UPI0036AC9433
MADGKRLIGHAGAVLLRRCADRTGLTDALARVLPSSMVAGWRDRAAVLVHLAVAIVLGAENLSEAEQLQLHYRPLFGFAASDSTARRMLAALDEATLARIAKARARVRRHVWGLLHLRPGGSRGWSWRASGLPAGSSSTSTPPSSPRRRRRPGLRSPSKRRSGFIR